jgi:hypothetical protein
LSVEARGGVKPEKSEPVSVSSVGSFDDSRARTYRSIEDEGEYETIDQYICNDKKRKGEHNPFDLVLNFYLIKSNVDIEAHDKTLSMHECIRQLNLSRQKLKDVIANAK